jgi:Bacterial Ig-like domain (group 3)/FG-GAP-like repeat
MNSKVDGRLLAVALQSLAIILASIGLCACPVSPPWDARVHPAPSNSSSTKTVTRLPHAVTKHWTATSILADTSASNPSEPVIAPFFGNLTAITSLPSDDVGLARQPDCSLTYFDFGASGTPASVSFNINSQIPAYEKTIHNNAFLTTTPDVFAAGCIDNDLGVEPQTDLNLGMGKSGQHLGAVAGGGNEVYTASINSALTAATTPAAQATPAPPFSIATADLNKDGNPDIVSVNTTGLASSVTVFLGNSDGSYQPGVSYTLPGDSAQFLVLDDLNGDGNLDILVSSSTQNFQFSVLLGNGDGTFQAPQSFSPPTQFISVSDTFITADVNGDGHKDIVTSRGEVLLGAGDGATFTLQSQTAFGAVTGTASFTSIVAADFNKDGKIDLAVDNGQVINIYLGNGDGTFTQGTSYAAIPNSGHLIATDLDGDGNVDLFTGAGSSGAYGGDGFTPNLAYALMGNGDGTFQGAPALAATYNGNNLVDLNGDGHLDLISPGTILVNGSLQSVFNTSLGQANGTFKPGPQFVVPPYVLNANNTYTINSIESFVVGDFNSDHIPDLIYNAGPAIPQAGYFLALGNGDGSFQTPTFIPAPSFEAAGDVDVNEMLAGFVAADFNHDGKLDIAYNFDDTSFNTHNITVGLAVQISNGDGTFQPPKFSTTYSSTTPPQEAFTGMIGGVADVNKDNFPDVFIIIPTVANAMVEHSTELFIGNGDGSFKAPVSVALTGDILPQSQENGFPIAVADLNGDGNVDLVVGGSSSDDSTPELAIVLGNGDGTFQPPSILTPEGFGFVGPPAIADFTGDGKFDVYADGIFPGNGDGTLQSINVGGSTVVAPLDIALSVQGAAVGADLSGDVGADLIVGNVVLLNQTGKSVTPPATAPTTTTLVSSLNPSASGQSVQFTATVTSTTAGTPTGTATFFDGNTQLGSPVTLNGSSVAQYSTSSLSVSTHSITAQYSGDSNFSASTSNAVSQVVNAASKASTTTTVVSSLNPSTSGQSVQFTATVTSQTAGTPTGTATFFDGNTQLGSAVTLNGSAAAQYSTSSLSTGSHSITAQYSGDSNFAASTSNAVSQQVNAAANADFSVSANPTVLNLNAGQSGSVTLTITPIGGSTQTIMLSCGSLPFGTTCAFSNSSVTLDGTHNATSTLTIQTSGASSAAAPPANWPASRLGLLIAAFAIPVFSLAAFWVGSRRLRPALGFALGLALLVAVFAGCAARPGTPAGSYSVSVALVAGADTHNVPITLHVSH